mgnify:CR=1 FL=1
MVVRRVDGRAANASETDRNLEFEDETDGGDHLAPVIVGLTYTFGKQFSTTVTLEDWRTMRAN